MRRLLPADQGKADKTSVETIENQLNGKADASVVDNKADRTELANYATISTVNTLSGKVDNKVDKSELVANYATKDYVSETVNEQVSGKANQADLDLANQAIQELDEGLSAVERENETLKEQVSSLIAQVNELRGLINNLQATVGTVETNIDTALTEVQ